MRRTLDGVELDGGGAQRNKTPSARKTVNKPRLNASLLLSPKGFAALRNTPIGSSHPDLDRVIAIYREWSNELFNGYHFEDFIDKVERECHSKYLQVILLLLK